jgi:hypothetical protein
MRRRRILELAALALGPLLVRRVGRAVEDGDLDPATRDLCRRVRAAYAGMRTYRDRGAVAITFLAPDGALKNVTTYPFTTAFARPDRLRYEFTATRRDGTVDRYLVARDARRVVRTWWDVTPGIKTGDNLHLALGAAAGVSGGSSSRLAPLLVTGEFLGGTWMDLRPIELLGDVEAAGRVCHRMRVSYPPAPGVGGAGTVETYFLDAESALLRRIEGRATFKDFRTETVTTYDPEPDAEIPDAALAFDPPAV